MARYTTLAIDDPADLLFGRAPHPLTTRRGLALGGGRVIPELNFTLPDMTIEPGTLGRVADHYRQIITGALQRAVELHQRDLVIEFETLPPMTEHPDWAMDIARILLDAMEYAHARHGLRTVLRMTPNDNREFIRPPVMRSGSYWQQMLELFERSAEAGAELLSIESVGGKEIHDEALQLGDLGQVIFAQCVLGARDMRFVWTKLAAIAGRHKVHAAGDTACGFANTAMVLAEQKMIPRVFAAVVRAISAVRSLVAYECGAVGPGKDCGYENIILKAVTGLPMACEGKSAACAHLSPIGNVAAAAADTWSNESVQNVKLLGGMAPTCMLESLIYDCRLMNQSLGDGPDAARQLQRWLVRSDAPLDPQACILTPAAAVRLAHRLVEAPDDYAAGRAVALEAVDLLEEADAAGELLIDPRERPWLAMMRQSLEALPDDENTFIENTMAALDPSRYKPIEYDLQLTHT